MARKAEIPIRSKEEIEYIAQAGRLAAQLRRELGKRVAAGVTTRQLDQFAETFMNEHGAKPAQKGFHGYPYAICAAVNDCVCHGMPDERALERGDIVTLDFVVDLDGWLADTAWTFAVGETSPEASRLRSAAYQAMAKGIEQAWPGKRIGDIAHAVQQAAHAGSYGVVAQFGGHGIGRNLHEPPEVSFVGRPGRGVRLEEGMVITIEPMITIGSPEVIISQDGWTVLTLEGGLAAQFEHTVAVTAEGPLILTK
ncbi:methionine aminopeptidase [Cohnella kolymensis]|uniref:Methionine aminopeptidase n=1 Tax=Cohnella kolymensis TaxID=1590652 RepID=A0ABR5A8W6_9BACL|nr:type I methionyl aminopeptidase [Cohnella kolymensis]KIL37516.1 methionine aminopeptidase [Cohnella kolymensis]